MVDLIQVSRSRRLLVGVSETKKKEESKNNEGVKTTMKQTIKSILAFAAVLFCGGAFAASSPKLLINIGTDTAVDGWIKYNTSGNVIGTVTDPSSSVSFVTEARGSFGAYGKLDANFTTGLYVDIFGHVHSSIEDEVKASLGLTETAFNEDVFKTGFMNAGQVGHWAKISNLDASKSYVIYAGFGVNRTGVNYTSGITIETSGAYASCGAQEYVVTGSNGTGTTVQSKYQSFAAGTAVAPSHHQLMIVRLKDVRPNEDGTVQFKLTTDHAGLNFLAVAEVEDTFPGQFMYSNQLAGSETVPAGTYGAITIAESTGGYKATSFASQGTISGGTGSFASMITRASNGRVDTRTHTVAGWFKINSLDGLLYAAKTANNGDHVGYKVFVDSDGKINIGKVKWSSGGFAWNGNVMKTASACVTADTWHHIAIAVTKNGDDDNHTGGAKVFVDGSEVTMSTSPANFATNLDGEVCTEIYMGAGVTVGGLYVDATALSNANTVKALATDTQCVREVNSVYKTTMTANANYSELIWDKGTTPGAGDEAQITLDADVTLTIDQAVVASSVKISGAHALVLNGTYLDATLFNKLDLTGVTGTIKEIFANGSGVPSSAPGQNVTYVFSGQNQARLPFDNTSFAGSVEVVNGTYSNLNLTGHDVANGPQNLVYGDGATATTERLVLGNQSSWAAGRSTKLNFTQKNGSSIAVTSTATSETQAATLFAHYQSQVVYDMEGGKLSAADDGQIEKIQVGWDGSVTWKIGCGASESDNAVVIAKLVSGTGRTNLAEVRVGSHGTLKLGSGGFDFSNTNNKKLYLQGGTIEAMANMSIALNSSASVNLVEDTVSTLSVANADYTMTINAPFAGTGAVIKAGAGTLDLGSSTRPKIAGMTGGTIKIHATSTELVARSVEIPTTMTEIPSALAFTVVDSSGNEMTLAESPYSISEGNLVIELAGEGPVNTSGDASELFAGREGNVPVQGGETADAAITINFDSMPEEVTGITVAGFVKVTGNAFPSGSGKLSFVEGGTLIFDGTDTAQNVTTHLWVGEHGRVITKGSVTFAKVTFEDNTAFDIETGTTIITATKKWNENVNDRGLNGTITIADGATLDLNCGDAINYNANVTVKVNGTLDLATNRQSINGGTKLFVLGNGTVTGAGDGLGALHFFDSNRLVVSGTKTISANIQMRDASHELTIAQFRTSNVTFSGVFSGSGKLKREGATPAEGNSAGNCGNSYVYLSGANTFGGTLTNNGGFMVLMPGVAFSATTTITSAANTELDFGTENASGTITLSNDITNSGNAMKIFADTTLSGTVSSTNGYAIQANGGNLHWAGTFTGAVANAGKLTIPQDVTFDTASNTLSGSGKIGGAGTLKSTTIPTVSVDTDWTGVVELAAIDYESTKTGYNLSGLVRDGSTLKLHGIVGNDIYFTNANKVNGTVELVDGAVLKFNNGNSDWKLAFGEITGTGTLRTTMDAPSGKPSGITVTIDKLSSKSVTLTSNNNALITVSNLVVEESYGTPLIPLSNCSAVTVSAVNGAAKETMQESDGIYLVAAKKGGVKYKTLQAAIDAGDDISDVVVYDVGATLPSGFALVRPTGSGDVKLRKAGEIYWKDGDWKADTTYYASSAKNSTTTYLTGDTVVFDTDTTVYYMQSWSEVVSAKIAENTTVIFGHNDWNGNTTRNIMSGSTITVAEGGRALFGFWDNKNNQGVPKIADLTINGAGTWGQANNLKDGVRANPGSLTISGTVTGTAKLVINEADEVKVLASGSVANNIVSGVDGKAVKVTTDAQSTKTYSLIDTSTDPIEPPDDPDADPVVIEDVGTGITMAPGAKVKVVLPADATEEQKADIVAKIAVKYGEMVLKGSVARYNYVDATIDADGTVVLTTTDNAIPAASEIAMSLPTVETQDKVAFTIESPVPGLFYSISSATDPAEFTKQSGAVTTSDGAQATAEDLFGKTISIPQPTAKVMYFKVSVKATK